MSGAALAGGLLAGLLALAAGAQGEASVRLEGPSQVARDGGPFEVTAVVSDARGLGAFEIEITYDPALVSAQRVEQGPFLGSSGRTVNCLEPRMERGFLRLVCVTLGPTPPGADGSGVLARFEFDAEGVGDASLEVARLALANPEGNLLPSTSEGTTVTVRAALSDGGPGWRLWGAIVAAGGVGAALLAVGWWRLRRPAV